jgi:hypothetical protein
LQLGVAKVANGIGESIGRKKANVGGVRREWACGSAGSEGKGEKFTERH